MQCYAITLLLGIFEGQLAKITVPTGLRFLVDPNATVVSVLLAALCTQSRSARLNGISSLSIAKKYGDAV
jgi:hypothetical protein